MIGQIALKIASELAKYIDDEINAIVESAEVPFDISPPKVICVHDDYYKCHSNLTKNDPQIVVFIQKIQIYPNSSGTNIGTFTIRIYVNDFVFANVAVVMDICHRFVQNTLHDLNTTDDYVVHFGKSLFAWKDSDELTFDYFIDINFTVTTKRW